MELKCINSNGEFVLTRYPNHIKLIFRKIVKIAFKNESYKLFFQKDALIVWKQDCL